jgi:hypothetical protein
MTTDRRRAGAAEVALAALVALLGDRSVEAAAAGHPCLAGSDDLDDNALGDSRGGLGRWSGEATIWARTGGASVLGERTRSVSLVESLRLRGEQLFGDERISFDAEGFTRQGFAGSTGGLEDDGASLATAAVTFSSSRRDAWARLGRQFVASGAAVRRLDGLALRAPLSRSFEADLFGGVPSDNGFGGASGDLLAGGRLGTVLGPSFRAGVSGFYVKDETDPSDAKGGLDLQWLPLRGVDLAGHVFYDWIADRIYDSRAHVVFAPSIEWQLAADWTRAVPGLFLPKNSIFSVFSVDDYEETALALTRRFDQALSARGFARYTAYEGGDDLVQVGAGLDGRYGPNGEDAAGAEIAYQDEERSGLGGNSLDGDALFVRAYHLFWWTASIYTSLDASVQFSTASELDRDPLLARALAGYDTHRSWSLECGVDFVRDPEFESRLDFFARLRVRF